MEEVKSTEEKVISDLESAKAEILRLNTIIRSWFYRVSTCWMGSLKKPVTPCEECWTLSQLRREKDIVDLEASHLRNMRMKVDVECCGLRGQLSDLREALEERDRTIAVQKEVLDHVEWDRTKGLDEQGQMWLTERMKAEARVLELTWKLESMNNVLSAAMADRDLAQKERDEHKKDRDNLVYQANNQVYRGNSMEYIYQKMEAYRNQVRIAFEALRALGFKEQDGGGVSLKDQLDAFVRENTVIEPKG